MKIIIAPDAFKGSLTALEVVRIVSRAAERVFDGVQIIAVPIADGGEGTVDALVLATGGTYREAVVLGPLGAPVTARFGVLPGGQTAVLEMAQASGIMLMPRDGLDPLRASTRGTGEMLLRALDLGIRDILLGIGGSATNDGGIGFLMALGAKCLDAQGAPVPGGGEGLLKIASLDLSGLDKRLAGTQIRVICDVTSPLLGETGATRVYGPQKGVDAALCGQLEAGMARYAALLEAACGFPVAEMLGTGAAGGLGAALSGPLRAHLLPGVEAVLDAVRFDELLAGADLVVTAEGRMDGQSIACGKAPVGVAHRCRALGVPIVALVGSMTDEGMTFCGGNASVMTTVNAPMTVHEAMDNAEKLLNGAAERMFRLIRIGRMMGR